MYEVILCALGVYAVTLVLSSYAGPFDIIYSFRSKLPSEIRDLVMCFVCLSFWVAIPFSVFVGVNLLEYIAIVGAAILAEQLRG